MSRLYYAETQIGRYDGINDREGVKGYNIRDNNEPADSV